MAEPEKKSDMVRRLVREREYRSALRIAKDFRLGINQDDLYTMRLAYECMVHPVFYRQIGRDLDIEVERGISVLVRLYGGKRG